MKATGIGDLSIRDYLLMTSAKANAAKGSIAKLARRAGLVVGALACTAAGDVIGPWTGKNTLSLPFEEGLAILEHSTSEPAKRAAIGSSFRGSEQALALLAKHAHESGKTGEYSRVALANVARQAVAGLAALDPEGKAAARQDIQHIFNQLNQECAWLRSNESR